MPAPKRYEFLPAFARLDKDLHADRAHMECTFDQGLSLGFLKPYIEKHWSHHLQDDPSCHPVFCLHLLWGQAEDPGLISITVADGNDSLTNYHDPFGMYAVEQEARISKAFLADILCLIFVDETGEFYPTMQSWRETLNQWVGYEYDGQTSFFVALRDPELVFIKDDQLERVPTLVATDVPHSRHNLLKAHDRAAALPRGIKAWCPTACLKKGAVSLFSE